MSVIDYRYPATLDRVIDGDTCILNVDLGFHTTLKIHCRLARINAPELNSTDPVVRERAQASKAALGRLLERSAPLMVQTRKTEKFGRWLAEIWSDDMATNASNFMVANGWATLYPGVI